MSIQDTGMDGRVKVCRSYEGRNILKIQFHAEEIPQSLICNLFGLWTAKPRPSSRK